jgi:NAD(P)-dependent dehydrogenase (short-subunit alcohol dehydrogenase family)
MSKVIVITGAGSGLGRALALRFADDGDQLVLLGRTMSKLEKVAALMAGRGLAVTCDIGDPKAVRTAFARIAETHKTIDVLINNAAMIDYTTLADASDEHIFGTVNTNLIGNLLCSRAAIHLMKPGGHIINVTSSSVEDPYPHHLVYQATKAGIEGMSRHLQDEIRPLGLRVSVVRAGPMFGEERVMQASPEAVQGFYKACIERGIDLSTLALSSFESVAWLFRSLIDIPADLQIDTVRFNGRAA